MDLKKLNSKILIAFLSLIFGSFLTAKAVVFIPSQESFSISNIQDTETLTLSLDSPIDLKGREKFKVKSSSSILAISRNNLRLFERDSQIISSPITVKVKKRQWNKMKTNQVVKIDLLPNGAAKKADIEPTSILVTVQAPGEEEEEIIIDNEEVVTDDTEDFSENEDTDSNIAENPIEFEFTDNVLPDISLAQTSFRIYLKSTTAAPLVSKRGGLVISASDDSQLLNVKPRGLKQNRDGTIFTSINISTQRLNALTNLKEDTTVNISVDYTDDAKAAFNLKPFTFQIYVIAPKKEEVEEHTATTILEPTVDVKGLDENNKTVTLSLVSVNDKTNLAEKASIVVSSTSNLINFDKRKLSFIDLNPLKTEEFTISLNENAYETLKEDQEVIIGFRQDAVSNRSNIRPFSIKFIVKAPTTIADEIIEASEAVTPTGKVVWSEAMGGLEELALNGPAVSKNVYKLSNFFEYDGKQMIVLASTSSHKVDNGIRGIYYYDAIQGRWILWSKLKAKSYPPRQIFSMNGKIYWFGHRSLFELQDYPRVAGEKHFVRISPYDKIAHPDGGNLKASVGFPFPKEGRFIVREEGRGWGFFEYDFENDKWFEIWKNRPLNSRFITPVLDGDTTYLVYKHDVKHNNGKKGVFELQGNTFIDITGDLDVRNLTGGCCGALGASRISPSGKLTVSVEQGLSEYLGNSTWKKLLPLGGAQSKLYGNKIFVANHKSKSLRVMDSKEDKMYFISGKDDSEFLSDTCNGFKSLSASSFLNLDPSGKNIDVFKFMRLQNFGHHELAACASPKEDKGTFYKMDVVGGELSHYDFNLEPLTATHLGGIEHDEAKAAVFMDNNDLALAGNFGTLANTSENTTVIDNAAATDRGKLLIMNNSGTELKSEIIIGSRIDDMDNAWGTGNIVLSGSFGVKVLSSDASELKWSNNLAGAPDLGGGKDGARTRAAIAENGTVAVLRDHTVFIFDTNGNLLHTTPSDDLLKSRTYVNDIAISKDGSNVYVGGFSNRKNGFPVQVAFLYSYNTSTLERTWRSYDYAPDSLDNDMADTRIYRVVIGHDGELYFAGESAGGNTIYRWNGKDLITQKAKYTDFYNHAYNARSAHIAYYAHINQNTGEVIKGQFNFPRLTSGHTNTNRVSDGDLQVSSKGELHMASRASAHLFARTFNKIAGEKVGVYSGGDMTYLKVSTGFGTRLRWTPFNETHGRGTLNAIAIKGNQVAGFGTVDQGSMHTHNALNSEPFNPAGFGEDSANDAYLIRWND